MSSENLATGIWNSIKNLHGKLDGVTAGNANVALGATTAAVAGAAYGGSGKDGSAGNSALGFIGGAAAGAALGIGAKYGLSKFKNAEAVADDIAKGEGGAAAHAASKPAEGVSNIPSGAFSDQINAYVPPPPKAPRPGAKTPEEEAAELERMNGQLKSLHTELNDLMNMKKKGRVNVDDIMRRINSNDEIPGVNPLDEMTRHIDEEYAAKAREWERKVTGPSRPTKESLAGKDLSFNLASTGASDKASMFEDVPRDQYNYREEVGAQQRRYREAKQKSNFSKSQKGIDGEFMGKNDPHKVGSEQRRKDNYNYYTKPYSHVLSGTAPAGDDHMLDMLPSDVEYYEKNVKPGEFKQVKGGSVVKNDPYSTDTSYKERFDAFSGAPGTPEVSLEGLLDNKRSHNEFEFWKRERADSLSRNNLKEHDPENPGNTMHEYGRMLNVYRLNKEHDRQIDEFFRRTDRRNNTKISDRSGGNKNKTSKKVDVARIGSTNKGKTTVT